MTMPQTQVEQNKAIAQRVYETFNTAVRTGNWAALNDVLAANAVDHNPVPGQEPGLAGIKQILEASRTAFPDLQFRVEDMIAEGEKVVSRLTMRGTHQGDFQGILPKSTRYSARSSRARTYSSRRPGGSDPSVAASPA
jgi:predicted ester cyclase